MRHAIVLPGSFEPTVKLAVVWFVGSLGPPVRVVFGGVRSIVHVNTAGVVSGLPASSVARTRNVWVPSVSTAVNGVEHIANAPPSMRHSNVLFGSVEVNVKPDIVRFVGSSGWPTIVVFGAVRSTVHVHVAGVGSGLPAMSCTRTAKSCGP